MSIIEFSEWLQKKIDAGGYNPNSLAIKAGIDSSIIYRALNRERMPQVDSLKAIASALNISRHEIMVAADICEPTPSFTELDQRVLHYLHQLHPGDQERVMLYLEVLAARYKYTGERP